MLVITTWPLSRELMSKMINKEKKKISVVTPCFNEKDNVLLLYNEVKEIFNKYKDQYEYEHIFIDNNSTDGTTVILNEMADKDRSVKLIVNSRNFGHFRSPYYAFLQATGDAVIKIVADFQEPPSLIEELIKEWENGHEIVIAVKNKSEESALMYFIRSLYYHLINKLADIKIVKNYTGFGIYDKKIVNILREINEPYPYFRGLVLELGFSVKEVFFTQKTRKRGISKNNFFTLYDYAMLGICSCSKIPLRIATLAGFFFSILSFMVTLVYLLLKLIFWYSFPIGTTPLLLGLFFFMSIQLFFIGIMGEYIGLIYTKITRRPLVIEKYRRNF